MDGDEVEAALRVLGEIRALPVDDPVRQRVQRAVDGLIKDAQRQRRANRRRATVAADREVVAGAATGAVDRPDAVPVVTPPEAPSIMGGIGHTRRERRCYACRDRFRTVDAFYHALCSACAELHRRHRDAGTDLRGRRAVVTGGRVKIGYQVALKLLRDGADVTVVTRFPADAARRYAREPDAATWLASLRVIGADLRDPRQVLDLAERLAENGRRLDILVNNAAQTVRRPAWAYQPLVTGELVAAPTPVPVESVTGYRPGATSPGWSEALADIADVPGGRELASVTDATGALVVPGVLNSWNTRIGEVDPVELLEVQLVNVVAPFLLVDRLRPALTAPGPGRRYVVNVTGREGWFGEDGEGPARHPHTSVSKAALNMLTRVGATDLARHRVYMCGVDTGWITDENPAVVKERRAARGWRPPLDVVDAAARIYHPIVRGEGGAPLHGVLLKNYAVVPW
ncbi:SDR family NAD(P)-dependent oxidoreductase [Micromonospora sp. NPDC050397]|uniref:SDR family NAD(P)-dependent oxidoreductase n=1 Tax=Micromonospora sp. NPDC050397 TaxID=3364279 RepID=UPI00384D73B1